MFALLWLLVPTRAGIAGDAPRVRDLGPLLGLRQHESSYTIVPDDYDHDGWTDFLIGHHGSRPAELFHNDHDARRSTGVSVALQLVDTIHDRPDRHGCIMGDPNVDGLTDIFCTKGARQGTAKKWNELWIQGPEGSWTDEAHRWGIEDIWGRGRYPTWIDLNHDRYPDLFVGNDIPRHDNHITPNRTFVNEAGARFREVDMGVTREEGGWCDQSVDVNHDGWDDLLVCGRYELYLYVREGDHFVRENVAYDVPTTQTEVARIEDVSGDGVLDLVMVHPRSLEVRLGDANGRFSDLVYVQPLGHGHGLAIGDIDGRNGPDIYAVEGCVQRVNVDDVLLLNGGDGRTWTQAGLPALPAGELAGCGDTADTLDFDRDGKDDFIVLNGGGTSQPLDLDGPDQFLTMGDWRPPT
jgi:VCBS repeat protein